MTKRDTLVELQRRIDWFEQVRKFDIEEPLNNADWGIYYTYKTLYWQIENNLFIGGCVK